MHRGFEAGKRPALLISECQRGVIDPELSDFPGLAEQVQQRGVLPRIARLAEAFRAAGLPVLHLHVAHRPGYVDLPRTSVIIARSTKQNRMIVGSEDVKSVPEVAPHESDIVHARSFSLVGFHGTDLDSILRNMGGDDPCAGGCFNQRGHFGPVIVRIRPGLSGRSTRGLHRRCHTA